MKTEFQDVPDRTGCISAAISGFVSAKCGSGLKARPTKKIALNGEA